MHFLTDCMPLCAKRHALGTIMTRTDIMSDTFYIAERTQISRLATWLWRLTPSGPHILSVAARTWPRALDSQLLCSWLNFSQPTVPPVCHSEAHLQSEFAEEKACSPMFWEFPRVWLLPLSMDWHVLTPKLALSDTRAAVWSTDACKRVKN